MSDTRRSTPAFAIGMIPMAFTCKICGDGVAVTASEAVRGVCEAHCFDHEYEYDGFDRSHYCRHCAAVPPDDWYACDDDVGVGVFSGSYSLGEPIGMPLSAMNGNAMERHADPARWANWVAFCERNGHP
jgi:hypothetical protein